MCVRDIEREREREGLFAIAVSAEKGKPKSVLAPFCVGGNMGRCVAFGTSVHYRVMRFRNLRLAIAMH